MNDLIKSSFESLLNKLESTEKFVLKEAPEVCKQMLAEKIAIQKMDLWFNSVFTVVLFVYSSYSIYYLVNYSMKWGGLQFCIFLGLLLSGFFTVICMYSAWSSLQNLVSLRIAPKVFLLNKLRNLIG